MTAAFVDLTLTPTSTGTAGLQVAWPERSVTARPLPTAELDAIKRAGDDLRAAEKAHGPQIADLRRKLGAALFDLLDGPERTLANLIREQSETGARFDLTIRLRGAQPGAAPHPAAAWRFELLADDRGPLACRSGITLMVQHGDRARHEPELLPEGRLRVLFLTYSPRGVQPVLDFEREEETVLGALAASIERGEALVHVVEEGSLTELERRLKADEYDVVYLSGHGELRFDGPRLLMEDELGDLDLVDPERLFACLQRGRKLPRLLVLASCETADGRADLASMAAALVARGLPTVAAWARPVRDDDATACARDLVERLCAGDPLPEAAAFARRELLAADDARARKGEPRSHAWGTFCVIATDGAGFRFDRSLPVPSRESPVAAETYRFLADSQMRVMESGFVGRRRPLQRVLRVLRTGREGDTLLAGVLLLGSKGVGKSCLAGRALTRHQQSLDGLGLVVLHGVCDEARLSEALRQQAQKWEDREAEALLMHAQEPFVMRLERLLRGRWARLHLVVVLDDFEQNLELRERGLAKVHAGAAPLLHVLLRLCRGGTPKLIVTSTAAFELPGDVSGSLAEIPLGPLDPADVRKLWTRGRDGELAHLSVGLWEELATRLGRNARVLDWARKLFAGKSNAELEAVVAKAKAEIPDWRGRMPDPDEQTKLAAAFLKHMAIDAARGRVSDDAQELVRRARVYTAPVPVAAFVGLAEGLSVELAEDLPALANFGLLELGEFRGERGYGVSPLVEPEFSAKEPERWHRVAAGFWISQPGCHFHARLGWSHACAARDQLLAEAASLQLDETLRADDHFEANAQIARQHAAAFPGTFRAHWWQGTTMMYTDIEGAAQQMRAARRLLTQTSDVSMVLPFLVDYGRFLQVSQQYNENLLHYRTLFAMARRAKNPGLTHHALVCCATALRHVGRLKPAKRLLEFALAHTGGEGAKDRENRIAGLYHLGCIYRALGQLGAAQDALDRVRRMHSCDMTPHSWMEGVTLHELAIVYASQHDYAQALRAIDDSIRVKRMMCTTHPDLAASLHVRGVIKRGLLSTNSDPALTQEAESDMREALAMHRKISGDRPTPHLAASYRGLGDLRLELGDFMGAEKLYRSSLSIAVATLSDEHYLVAQTRLALAAAVFELGRIEEAVALINRAEPILVQCNPDNSTMMTIKSLRLACAKRKGSA